MYQVNLYSHVSYDPFYIYQGSYQVLNDQKKENGNLLAKFKDLEMSKNVYKAMKKREGVLKFLFSELKKDFLLGSVSIRLLNFI